MRRTIASTARALGHLLQTWARTARPARGSSCRAASTTRSSRAWWRVARGLKVGPGLDESTDIGPLVSREQTERVLGYLTVGASEGHMPVGGGRRIRAGLRAGQTTVQPSVIADNHETTRVLAQEEIFGPVVVALPFKDEDDLVRKAQRHDVRPGCRRVELECQAGRTAWRTASRPGTVWVNCYGAGDVSVPFGGFKQSGHGREMGEYALELYNRSEVRDRQPRRLSGDDA